MAWQSVKISSASKIVSIIVVKMNRNEERENMKKKWLEEETHAKAKTGEEAKKTRRKREAA
jgi:hypothetical protein